MALCSTSTVEIGMYCMECFSQFFHQARHVRSFSPLLYQRPEPFQGWIRMEEGKGGGVGKFDDRGRLSHGSVVQIIHL